MNLSSSAPWKTANTLLRAMVVLTCLTFGRARAQTGSQFMVYDFELGGNPISNVDQVRTLGFDGLVTRCSFPSDLPKLASYVGYAATMNNFDVLAYVNYDFTDPNSTQVWRDALPMLASAGAPLWVIVKNAPSSIAVRDLLSQMAQKSQLLGVRTVVYPHWNTNIENAAEAAAIIAQVGHPNLVNSLHTCHEIRSGNQSSLGSVVAAHVSNSQLVTIAGADENAYAGPPPAGGFPWDDVIKPLDSGRHSLKPFLQALKDGGYNGPVILHTFGVTNDPGHLARSLGAYNKYQLNLL